MDLLNLSCEDKILRAKIQLQKSHPFFAYILVYMKQKEDKELKYLPFPTMGVNNQGDLYWNSEFVKELDEDELKGVLCHEVLHIALMHLERSKGKDPMIMNLAEDLIINDILVQSGMSLPKGGAIPDDYHSFEIFGKKILKLNEKCSEEVYEELYKNAPKLKIGIDYANSNNRRKGDGENKSQQSGNNSNGQELTSSEKEESNEKLKRLDNHLKDEKGKENKSEKNKRINKWKNIIAEAAQTAKQRGKLPLGMERLIDELLEPKINWKEKLYKYIVDQIINDYTWNLPSKRTAALGIYLPKTTKESVHIVVSIDTSGSIGQDELKDFISELLSIGQQFININMDIIICDAKIHEVYNLQKGDLDDIISLRMSGGGGTSHVPIYDRVLEEFHDTKVLINFTDGYTDLNQLAQRENNFHFDTLWVISKGGIDSDKIPFGEVIRLSNDE